MSFFGRLFGTNKAISDITDKENGLLVRAGGWVDGLSHTEQEKAAHSLEVRKWGLSQLEALAPFKIVQRILAFSISSVWILLAINVVISLWVEAFHPDILIADKMLRFAFSDYIFWPATVCFGLYFGGGFVESIRRAK